MLLLIFIAAFSLLFLFLLKQRKNEPFHPPPGPKGLPLIGNIHQFEPSKPHVYFAKLAKTYGPILHLRIGRRSIIVIQSAKLAKEVLQTQDKNFCNRLISVGGRRLCYNGVDVVFSPYGEYFREIKKIFVVHLLSTKRVESFASIREEEVSRLIHKISSLSSASKVVNLNDLLMKYANSHICRIAFGKSYDDYEGSRSRFHDLLNEAQALFAELFFTDYFPCIGWLIDKLKGKYSRLEKTFKELDEFYEEIIEDHLDLNNDQPKSERDEDIITILLRLRKESCFPFELTMEHIKAMLMDIFSAGTDTSTAMVVWTMTELMRNPCVMEKVQEEIRNAFRNKGHIVESDLSNLEYFKAVVKETFRLHPATPLLVPRETLQKSTLGGYDILAKDIIYVNLWAIGRDADSWKDPDMFMPERFIKSSINFLGRDFELIPFGAGRRICPGLHLGIASMELVLANMLYHFDWELPNGIRKEDIDTDVQLGVVMHKKTPLCLIAKKNIFS